MTVEVSFFGEDFGHESFCVPLILRIAAEAGHEAECTTWSAAGGRPNLERELRSFVRSAASGAPEGDVVVIATDSNCRGRSEWDAEIRGICDPLIAAAEERVVTLCPDPHVERWMLLDSAAFRTTFGRGCGMPDQKCERGRYKKRLVDAILEADVEPTLGGMEYAGDIVESLDLNAMIGADDSLGRAIQNLRTCFRTGSLRAGRVDEP